MNENGEIIGYGPEWSCSQYGHVGHDYTTCEVCLSRYQMYLAAKADLVRFGVLQPACATC